MDFRRFNIPGFHFLKRHFGPLIKIWGPLYNNFGKNFWAHHGLSRVPSWDHFLDPKSPLGPVGTPRMAKIIFLRSQDMETLWYMVEKRIFDLSPIEKNLVRPYQALGGHFGFWAVQCWRPRFFSEDLSLIKEDMAWTI